MLSIDLARRRGRLTVVGDADVGLRATSFACPYSCTTVVDAEADAMRAVEVEVLVLHGRHCWVTVREEAWDGKHGNEHE